MYYRNATIANILLALVIACVYTQPMERLREQPKKSVTLRAVFASGADWVDVDAYLRRHPELKRGQFFGMAIVKAVKALAEEEREA